jgi:hypothetical protein
VWVINKAFSSFTENRLVIILICTFLTTTCFYPLMGRQVGLYMTCKMGFGLGELDLLTPYSHNSGLQAIQRYRWSTHFTVHRHRRTREKSSLVVSWQRIYNILTITSNHTWSLLFTAQFLSCHYSAIANSEDSTQFNSSAPKLISWQAGISEFDQLSWTLLYNHFARTTQKTQHIYCWEGIFIAPLHSNGSYSIVAYLFVSAGLCLPSCCLAMDVYFWLHYSGFRVSCHNILNQQ